MPALKHVTCLSSGGFHRMAYREWGSATAARTLVCVHGLARNGRDFDLLAERLAAAGWRVVCPDVAGRGDSEPLPVAADYGLPQYLRDMTVLLARLEVAAVDWLGTSMGGLIGISLAALPGSPVRRLAVNDVGPFLPKAALVRIAGYLGKEPLWPDLAAAERHYRAIYAGFGPLSDAEWRRFTAQSVRRQAEGGYRAAYDPAIAEAFRAAPLEDVELWPLWEAITCPTLVLRGAQSDLLLADTAQEMTRRGPRAELVEIAGCGHAPALLHEDELRPLLAWLGTA